MVESTLPKSLPPDLTESSTSRPADFTAPSTRYRLLTWLVSASLVAFLAFYVALIAVCASDVWLGIAAARSGTPRAPFGLLFAPVAGLILALALRGLWGRVRSSADPRAVEIRAADEPELFATIHAIADRVRAPRPHKVFLVPDVNAAVAFDSSVLQLVLPTRKNLLLGLGCVNALSRDQLVAVLAHEFGHFSQSSMRLGRWVYVAGDVIGRVAAGDSGVAAIAPAARADLRLAAVVAVVVAIVAAVRTGIGGLYVLLHLPSRALSREMELHADKVAVSIAGSDALCEALQRLHAADVALDGLWTELSAAASGGRVARDVYALHARALEDLDRSRPELALPAGHATPDPARRLFAASDGAPRMWAHHPPNAVREEAAKTPYIVAARDDRPAWSLFRDPAATRQAMSRVLAEELAAGAEVVDDPRADALSADRAAIYGDHFVALADPEAAMRPLPALTDEELGVALARRHGADVRQLFRRHREARADLGLLMALASGQAEIEPGQRLHGQALTAASVPALAERTRDELVEVVLRLERERRDARVAARIAAERLGPEWVAAHRGALAVLHYVEREAARLQSVHGGLASLVHSASRTTERRVCAALAELHRRFLEVVGRLGEARAEALVPGEALLSRVLTARPVDAPDGLNVVAAWVGCFGDQLSRAAQACAALATGALSQLLDLEDRIEAAWLASVADGVAPPAPAEGAASLPSAALEPHDPSRSIREIVVPRKARMAKVQGASSVGARLAAAAGVLLAPALVLVYLLGTDVILYNGTDTPAVVVVGGGRHDVGPHERVAAAAYGWGRADRDPARRRARGRGPRRVGVPRRQRRAGNPWADP